MTSEPWLDQSPLWGLYLATVALLMLANEIGFRVGRYRRRVSGEDEKKSQAGGIMAAALGLLAFMLAFTFGMAASRFTDRKQVVVAEANATGTTYLRTELLADPYGPNSRELLREYLQVRLNAVESGDAEQMDEAMQRSDELHRQLWSLAMAAAKENPNSIDVGLYINSLNELIDLHTTRVTAALRNRIPASIWLTLYFVATIGMVVMGYHAGLLKVRSSIAALALVLTFSAVMLLIIDLNRPYLSLFEVNQQALIDLESTLGEPEPVEAGTP